MERSGALEPRISAMAEEYEAEERATEEAATAERLAAEKEQEKKEQQQLRHQNKERVRVRRHRSKSIPYIPLHSMHRCPQISQGRPPS